MDREELAEKIMFLYSKREDDVVWEEKNE